MTYILAAAVGLVASRWLSWFSLVAASLILAIAVGIEGAVHARTLLKILERGFYLNVTLQGAYFTQAILQVYGHRLLGRPDK